MKISFLILCMTGAILLTSLVLPVAAEASTISGISPAQAYTGTTTGMITITGSNFNTTLVTVRLIKEGKTNITAAISSHTSTSIKCKFTISSSATVGSWDVVVVNRDGSEVVDPNAFTVRRTMTLSSVNPSYALTNNDSVEVTLAGTGLSDVESMYLFNSEYNNITAVIDDIDSTQVVGTFDLTGADIDTYKICIEDSFKTVKCGLSFDVLSDDVGSIEVESSPSGAKVYLDSVYVGITPTTVEDVEPGSHKVLISKTGYVDYIKWVTVKTDSTASVSADLDAVETAATTRVPTSATTQTPLKANTVKVPTPWPTNTTTPAASVEPFVIIGAIAAAFVLLREH